ncbi:cellulose synthase subunit BcsC-related outer membrane protein, partial [Pseudomonas aeruginosa]
LTVRQSCPPTPGQPSKEPFVIPLARALLERRVTSNWFVGTAIDIQQAKDYAPSHFLLYVRYSAAGWQGDMDLPPQPLIPYADW